MDKSFYSMDISSGWILLTCLVAFILSGLLYSKKNIPWQRNINWLLGFIRFTALLLIGLLLINPTLRLSTNEAEAPIILVAYDNSSSINMRMEKAELDEVRNGMIRIEDQLEADYQVAAYDFNGQVRDSLNFNHPSSNLSSLFKNFDNLYEDRNVGAILLLSDGIYNEGLSPEYLKFRHPVFAVGLSDTIPPRDVLIATVKNNRVAYQGNKFPLFVEVEQYGFEGQTAQVTINESGKELARKTVNMRTQMTRVPFEIEADQPGLKHLVINVAPLSGESTTDNNRKDVFIDIIEGKEKILIVSSSPHPDIRAIREVLQQSGNYESSVYIPGTSEKPKEKEFDVIIEMMASTSPIAHGYSANGTWYILGTDSNLKEINKNIPYLNVLQRSNQMDLVRPAINQKFRKFEIKEEFISRANNYPPVEVPFGEYNLSGPAEILIFQKVGSVVTSKPFMVFYDDGTQKSAVTMGSGLWQWRLQEAALNDRADLFNEIVLKTIQFLSIHSNKQQFAVVPRQNVYNEGERIFLETQVYNDIFERTYGNKIALSISNESGDQRNYELTDSPINSAFNIGSMPQGIYRYKASVQPGNEVLTDEGEFLVQSLQIESLDLTANHHLLREVAANSNGKFYHYSELDKLQYDLQELNFEDIIRTQESYFPLIKSLWLIFIILGLLFTEWFFRKYLGLY